METLKLDENSIASLLELPEMQMGIQYIQGFGAFDREIKHDISCIVLSSYYVLPITRRGVWEKFLCLEEGIISTRHYMAEVKEVEVRLSFEPKKFSTRLHQRNAFLSAFGQAYYPNLLFPLGMQRVLSKTTEPFEGFLRFSFSNPDPRINSATGVVSAGTFAAPFRDGQKVSSGFEAVGRYASPVPLPYSFVTLLIPPKDTIVEIGTVGPNFGQAGGGVEAFFPNRFTNKLLEFHHLPDY